MTSLESQNTLLTPEDPLPADPKKIQGTRWYITPKILYLLLNMAVYSVNHFGLLYIKNIWKIPDAEISLLSILTSISFIGSILWTGLADRFKLYRSLLIILTILFSLSFASLEFPFIKMFFMDDVGNNLRVGSKNVRMLGVAIFYSLTSFFTSGLFPLLDIKVLQILTEDGVDNKDLYGRQRLWGAVGQACVGLLIGKLLEYLGFLALFCSLITLFPPLLCCYFCIHFPIPTRQSKTETNATNHIILEIIL